MVAGSHGLPPTVGRLAVKTSATSPPNQRSRGVDPSASASSLASFSAWSTGTPKLASACDSYSDMPPYWLSRPHQTPMEPSPRTISSTVMVWLANFCARSQPRSVSGRAQHSPRRITESSYSKAAVVDP